MLMDYSTIGSLHVEILIFAVTIARVVLVGQKYILFRPNLHKNEAKSAFSIPREKTLSNRKTDTKRAHFIFSRNTPLTSHNKNKNNKHTHEKTRIDGWCITSHRLSNLCVDHLLHCKPNMYLKEHKRSETWKP
jgi:hypothetical protein